MSPPARTFRSCWRPQRTRRSSCATSRFVRVADGVDTALPAMALAVLQRRGFGVFLGALGDDAAVMAFAVGGERLLETPGAQIAGEIRLAPCIEVGRIRQHQQWRQIDN